MGIVLNAEFFAHPAPVVAPRLLGKYLVRRLPGQEIASMITETEAYEGMDDLACHASRGRTRRTEVMFGQPGRFYVYLIYGMHQMLNVVTHAEDRPSAVLIRGLALVSGPGRLTRTLDIGKELNTLPACPDSGLWFEDRGDTVDLDSLITAPRVGVDYAGPVWAGKPWRFMLPSQGR